MVDSDATIEVTRRRGRVDRLRSYRVMIDGKRVGTLKAGEQKAFTVPAGRHEVEARIDWTRSPTVELSLQPNETVSLECVPSGNPWVAMLRAVFNRGEYIQLRRLDERV